MMKEREDSAVNVIGRLAGRLILVAVFVLVLFVLSGYAFDFGKSIFYQKPMEEPPGTDVIIELAEGDGPGELAEKLKEKGVIADELAVSVQARLYKTELVPGEYTVNTSMTTRQMLGTINTDARKIKEEADKEENADVANVVGGGDEGGDDEAGNDEAGAPGTGDSTENAASENGNGQKEEETEHAAGQDH